MLLLDPGTLEYVGPTNTDRAAYRGTAAHNTLRVDGVDQAEPAGPFAWTSLPKVECEGWALGRSFDFFVGSHDGYGRLRSPVTHRRFVFHRKSRFWLVRDVADGSGQHNLELLWHLGPTLAPVSARDYVFRNNQESLALLTAQGHGWSQSAHRGYWSPAYGRQERAMVLSFSKAANLPAEFVTLLLSQASVQSGIGHLESMPIVAGARGYRYAVSGEEHCFLFSQCAGAWTLGAWTSDASFLYWWVNRKLGQRMLIAIGGTFVECSGTRVLSSVAQFDYVELVSDSGRTEMTSSPSDAVQLSTMLDALEPESTRKDPERMGV
jgi:hypothetical protein